MAILGPVQGEPPPAMQSRRRSQTPLSTVRGRTAAQQAGRKSQMLRVIPAHRPALHRVAAHGGALWPPVLVLLIRSPALQHTRVSKAQYAHLQAARRRQLNE